MAPRLKITEYGELVRAAEKLKVGHDLARSVLYRTDPTKSATGEEYAFAFGLVDAAILELLECFGPEDEKPGGAL